VVLPFLGEGKTPGGIEVVLHDQTFKHLAIVLATERCEQMTVDRKIVFEEGTAHPIVTAEGERLAILHEDAVLALLPET
jgi:hypothetical protein